MELRQYVGLVLKWWWLIVLTTLIAAGSSYLYSRALPPTYRADTTVLVGRILDNPTAGNTDVQSAANLAQAYVLLATQPPILKATAEAIGWPDSWQSLFFQIKASSSGNQLVMISAMADDPASAQKIANETAHQLILQGPVSSQQKQAEEQQTFITSQLAKIKLQIESTQNTLAALTNQAALENDPVKLSDLNTRISALQTKITDWQKNYASLSALLNSGSNLFVTVLAPALLPTSPASPNIPQNVLFAALAGLVLAGGAILLLEYLDDTLKGPEDTQRALSLTALGTISRIGGIHAPTDHLITLKHPRSPISEAYRVLRTNLQFTGIENPSGALLVTSGSPGEGKTITSANLAVIFAQAGRRVILMDADLRRPSVDRFFGLPNQIGVTSLFLGDAPSLESICQATAVEDLRVITSGPLPPNPAEILDSHRMTEILASLRAQCDILILDSPPVLAVADACILGSRCSGVVLVVDAGHTRTEAGRHTVEVLRQTGAKLSGVVLNKVNLGRARGYYNHSGYHGYYSSRDGGSGRNGHEPHEKQPSVPVN